MICESNPNCVGPDCEGCKNEKSKLDISVQSSDLLCSVLANAISAIYFDDSSDFRSTLWSIVGLINPKAAELLEKDEREAYKIYVESVEGT